MTIIYNKKILNQKRYWLEKMNGIRNGVDLGLSFDKPKSNENNRKVYNVVFDTKVSDELNKVSKNNNFTLHIILMTMIKILIYKYSDSKHSIVTTVSYNTKNLLPIYDVLDDNLHLREVLGEVKKSLHEAHENQDYPLNKIVKDLGFENERNKLSDVLVLLDNIDSHGRFSINELHSNLIFRFKKSAHNLILEINYSNDELYDLQIRKLSDYLSHLLEFIIENKLDLTISDIDIIRGKERHQLLSEFNNTDLAYPFEKTIHEIFEEQAQRAPEQVAVVYEQDKLTYKELNQRANQLARYLREKGVKEESIVGIMMDRSLEMMISILGVLKAGGAYLPIDKTYPKDRVDFMLQDTNTQWVLCQKDVENTLRENNVSIITLDDSEIYKQETSNPNYNITGKTLAYIIYTSGSTGIPKGVMVEHHSVINRLFWMENQYNLIENEVILQKTPFTFDVSVWELFWWFFVGAKVVFLTPDGEKNPESILQTIERHKITKIHFVPSMLQSFINYLQSSSKQWNLKSLNHVFTSGESLNSAHVNLFYQLIGNVYSVQLSNLYGPTEATVEVTYYNCTNDKKLVSIPIGKPISNIKIYILTSTKQMTPIGVAGELYISGAGVARGYLNQPEMTAEKFLPDPFNPGERMYRTGDLAKWLPDGNIEYLGRIDNQVKIRGYRIELGEVESRLSGISQIKEAVVTAPKDAMGTRYLCAYVVSDKKLHVAELKVELGQVLPSYMIPTRFIQIAKLPLTTNGKVDRKNLPDPTDIINDETNYMAPRTDIEKQLVEIWSDVLQIEKIGITDNFFDLGGHSLKATAFMAKIGKKLHITLALKEIFENPTIESISQIIEKKVKEHYMPILPVKEQDYYAASSAQKRLLIINQLESIGVTYNMPGAFILEGNLDLEQLHEAFKKLIIRHESLRTSFSWLDGEPIQEIHQSAELDLQYNKCAEIEISEKIKQFIKPFDLSIAPLLRVEVWNIGLDKHMLLFDMHHIISDGISINILTKELKEFYEGNELPALAIQYKDYTAWQNEQYQTDKLKQQETYWLDKFDGEIPILELPTDYQRPPVQTFKGSSISFNIDSELTEGLKNLAHRTNSTLYTTLLAAYSILLAKYTGQEDIIIGTPVSGRTHADAKDIMGMFVNTVAIRTYPRGEKTFLQLVEEVKRDTLEALENQDYPYDVLVEKLELKRDLSRNPLFDTMFTVQNVERVDLIRLGEIEGIPYPFDNMTAKFDLTFTIEEKDNQLILNIEYAKDLFNPETIKQVSNHYVQLLNKVIDEHSVSISQLNIITEKEKQQLLSEFNNTDLAYPFEKTIHEIFEEQAQRAPEQVAVVYEQDKLTYKELNQRANQLARYLREKGVKEESIVGIMMDRSLEMMISILGVLKAGGAYLPIDKTYPKDRVDFMLQDTNTQWVLCQKDVENTLRENNVSIITLDDSEIYKQETSNPNYNITGKTLAYIIYTSGSTGIPKGVMVEHHSVINRLFWMQREYFLAESDVILQKTPFTFDVSVWELFWWFFVGAKVVFLTPDGEKNPESILQTIERHKITKIHFVPSMLQSFINYLQSSSKQWNLKSLNHVFTSGESLNSAHVNLFYQLIGNVYSVQLSNLYGPTEATVDVTYYNCTNDKKLVSIPIGKPISNIKIYILTSTKQMTPIGVAGELYISGAGVARGYLNQPEMTAEKFLPDPFNPGERMYRTGDLAKWLPDGNIEYLGRIDNQVKIRGYRIELDEIESRLTRISQIKEAVVTAPKDAMGTRYLCAYVVSDKKLHVAELKVELGQVLPSYMIPTRFIQLEKLPLTTNGKVDRKNLPDPTDIINDETNYMAPRTDIEKQLVKIWSNILKIDKFGINDDFFSLGGHSLKAISLISFISKSLHVSITLQELFENPTIESISQIIEKKVKEHYMPILPVKEQDYYATSSAQKRLLIINQLESTSVTYNMPGAFILEGNLDLEQLHEAFKKLIIRHESLRTSFSWLDGEPIQEIHQSAELDLQYNKCAEIEISEKIKQFIKPFDLSIAPLLRVEVWNIGLDKHMLLFDMHHIISDGISINILTKELKEFYEGNELPALAIQYKDYTAWQNEQYQTDKLKQQETYWLDKFDGEIPILELPTDYQRPPVQTFKGSSISFNIDSELTEGLKNLAHRTNSTLYTTLLAAYSILLAKYTGQEDIIIGTPVSGRTHADVKDIMGMFVNTVAIRTYPRGEKTFLQLVEEVKRDTLEALENQDYPYDVLVEKLELKRDLSRNPLFDTMFDLQHVESIVPFELGDTHVSPYELTNTTSKFDLTFTIEEKDSQLTLNIEYATSLFDIEIIESLKNHFIQILYNVTQNSSNKISQINIIENIEEEGEDCINKDFLSSFTEKVFHEIFEQQVSKTPNKIAVVCGEETLTYDELNKKSNQLARKLVSLDVNSDTIVGIIADKSLGMIVGILGVLKAGGAYVPIDPTTPLERITSIIDDCGAEIILTNKNYYHLINNQQKIDLDEESLFKGNSCNLNISVNKDDLVYVIYTSGSTGKPKGVMISHKNYLSIAYSWNNIYKLQEFDVKLLQLASFSFDVFAGDLARTLLFGGQLILCSTDTILDFKLLSQLIVNNKINILESTPKLLIPLLQYIYENKVDVSFMKIIIFGSDVCPMPDFKIIIQRFGGNIRIFNTYGTTETTIDSLFYEGNSIANKECNYVPIGKAFPNTKTYVLNRYLQKQPVGVIGELYIEGEGIARGYLNNINLTEEKFIPNPFNKHSRLYKTGDLVRKLKDGNIEFIGRKDNQVKISGYRIELGEIETFILGYDGIDNVVVNIGSNETGDEFFCAYIESKYEIDIKQLKNYLYLHLPKYMIPDSFVLLKSLPLSKNGKIEKKSLPIPNKKFENKKYIPPNNDIEIMITNIWSEILNVENIGRNDNFFDLGGNSLKIVTFVNWLRKEFKFDIPVQLIFNNPNVQMIAKIIAEKSNKVTKSSLVELTRLNNPKKKNIICFPPIIGLGMIYSKMAELLNNKFSLYALDIPEENINIMDIIEKLKKIQDKSPFIFLSYSAGGNLAFEVAKVMENKGISVSCIVMLDSLPLNNIVKASTEAIEFEIENAMTDYVENSGKFLGSALIKEQLKDEDFYIRKKMRSFIKFLNNTINKPYINADIHLINANNNYDIDKKLIKWEGYTKKFTEHKGYGEHKEMFNSYNIIKNTEVIQKILGKY